MTGWTLATSDGGESSVHNIRFEGEQFDFEDNNGVSSFQERSPRCLWSISFG